MKIQVTLVLAVVTTIFSVCDGHVGRDSGNLMSMVKSKGRTYCGEEVARILTQVCSFQPIDDKRITGGSMDNEWPSQLHKHRSAQSDWPWISHHHDKSLTIHDKLSTMFDECCMKPCTIDDIMMLC